jgi:phosphoribosylanthranilate isomerase
MKTKICGITRLEDAEAAVSMGAWAIGLNHSAESSRQIDPEEAERIGASMKRKIEVAGVFVNAHLDEVKAFRVKSPGDVAAARAFRTDFHLFDAYGRGGQRGGSGETFDWDLVATRKGGVPALLAGGLTPDNVGEAIAASNPWGVDVASGVESAPGIKDHNLMESFLAAAGRAGVIQREQRERHRAMKRIRQAVGRRTRA